MHLKGEAYIKVGANGELSLLAAKAGIDFSTNLLKIEVLSNIDETLIKTTMFNPDNFEYDIKASAEIGKGLMKAGGEVTYTFSGPTSELLKEQYKVGAGPISLIVDSNDGASYEVELFNISPKLETGLGTYIQPGIQLAWVIPTKDLYRPDYATSYEQTRGQLYKHNRTIHDHQPYNKENSSEAKKLRELQNQLLEKF